MKTIAITGSKGKTTIVHVLKEIMRWIPYDVMTFGTEWTWFNEERLATYVDIIWTKIREKIYTPDFILVEAVSRMLKRRSVPCDIAIFTNLEEHEHWETHPNFQDYLNSKKRLFDECTWIAIVNADCEYTKEMIKDCKAKIITYWKDADYTINMTNIDDESMSFTINWKKLTTKLLGEFNMYNLSAAIIALEQLEIYVGDISDIKEAPWRFERFKVGTNTVILDYAHTCNSLEQTLKLIRKLYTQPVITVFGCGGDRDKGKRPLMGQIAMKYSHRVYLTTDNPRNEKPEHIIKDIAGDDKRFHIILDRETAIKTALKENNHAIILIAGRWNEETTEVNNRKLPMKDRDFIH